MSVFVVRNQTVALFQQSIPATCPSTPAQQQEKVYTHVHTCMYMYSVCVHV